jgi:hypothetical protein
VQTAILEDPEGSVLTNRDRVGALDGQLEASLGAGDSSKTDSLVATKTPS